MQRKKKGKNKAGKRKCRKRINLFLPRQAMKKEMKIKWKKRKKRKKSEDEARWMNEEENE